MSYTSSTYLLGILGGVFVLYSLLPKKHKWISLLLGSMAFFFLSSRWVMVFMIIAAAAIYLCGIRINKINDALAQDKKKATDKSQIKALKTTAQKKKKLALALGLAALFSMLLALKYINFFGGIVNSVSALFTGRDVFSAVKLLLPVGISYYTLQGASYIIDVYRGKYRADTDALHVLLFLSFFPQTVEGPIGRYDTLMPQLTAGKSFSYDRDAKAMQLILWGLFKKIVIANRANALVKAVFSAYGDFSGAVIAVAVLAYTLQIYADFSGCIDIVRGSAELFGVTLDKNFERPFFSKNVNEFWRRWHITLGAWLRDYIFYPISLSKPFRSLSQAARERFGKFFAALIPSACALFFVWLANGFWHGADWKYICYGLYYYVIILLGMLCEPLFLRFFKRTGIKRDGAFRYFSIFRTFILVNFGMLIFRANTLGAAGAMVGRIFAQFRAPTLFDGTLLNLGKDCIDFYDYIVLIVGAIVLLIVGLLQERGISLRNNISKKPIPVRWTVYFAIIFAIIIFGAYGSAYAPADMIYGRF